ncbi:FecR family protein [uncultured Psychroserpens sp.]|uniref:FecR family protein n=1 Tax=uncultured Psychroserpens sp. TaxID=255436 RepID=UPI002632FBAF|nr:FecR family protein [uncultured Psychroserpens sp.]
MDKDELLEKWLNNALTDVEMHAFSKREDYQSNQKIIDMAKHFKASKFSTIEDFDTFRSAYQEQPLVKRLNWFNQTLRIASVIVIALGLYFTFFNNQEFTEEHTLAGEKMSINLPDQSKITLNADSQISYDIGTWDSERSLTLKGEAYFKVAKGKTFAVVTSSGTVTVVGTEFNVKQRSNFFEVICYEGIVKVTSDTTTRQLLAGDTYRILNEKFTQDNTLDTEPNWINDKSSFKAVPFKDVVAELERQYNITVMLKEVNVARTFTGGFTHNNIEEALAAITLPMDLKFEISSPNQVLIHDHKN